MAHRLPIMPVMSALHVADEAGASPVPVHARLFNHEALGVAAIVFLISRLPLLVVSIAVAVIQRASPWAIWNQWDTTWYLGIAGHGYHWINPGHYASQFSFSTLAFFPAFPALLRGVESLGIPGIVAGLIIANLALFLALIYLYAVFTEDWGTAVARRALFVLALFPTAFFFAAPYTEPLFLLAAAATLYHARRGQAIHAGLWLALAALTRSSALILVAPALLLLPARDGRKALALLVPSCIAWPGYLLYLRSQGIGVTALANAQHAWHRGLTLPTTGFTASITWLLQNALIHWPIAIESIGGVVVTSLFLLLTARAWPDLALPMRAYCVGFWLLVLCTPEWLDNYPVPFSSVDRFVIVLFPLAAWAAMKLEGCSMRVAAIASGAMMAVLGGIHLSGGWIG